MLNSVINFEDFKDEVSPGIFRKLRYALWLFTSNIFFLTNIPYHNKLKFTTHEEAELACLAKLIEIVKVK